MTPVRIIQPSASWSWIDWREIWQYRELLFFLTQRDIKVRYKQTIIGAGWVVLQPAVSLIVFVYVFGRIGGFAGDGTPYSLFVLTGLLPWMLFASAVNSGSQSVISNAPLITKVYFPRFIIPLAALGTCVFDFLVSLGLLALLMAYHGVAPPFSVVLTPFVIVALTMIVLGIEALLAALVVLFRDVRHVVPFLVQLGFFVTPVVYPPGMVPVRAQWLLYLNPMAGVIQMFRASVLGTPVSATAVAISLSCGAAAFLAGCLIFRVAERRFADIV